MRRSQPGGRKPAPRTLRAAVLATSLLWPTAVLAITVDNVVQMHKSGLPAAVIVQTINSTGSKFSLTVEDMKALEAAGVPKDVVETMLKSTAASGAPAPEPAPGTLPEAWKPGVGALREFSRDETPRRYRLTFGFVDHHGRTHHVSCLVDRAAHAAERTRFGYAQKKVNAELNLELAAGPSVSPSVEVGSRAAHRRRS